jgi:aldehyde dehydrogenase (NAD+)
MTILHKCHKKTKHERYIRIPNPPISQRAKIILLHQPDKRYSLPAPTASQAQRSIHNNQQKIEAALWEDLHKSPEETYLTEISIVTKEIDNHIKHLKKWTRPRRVPTPLHLLPSSSRIVYEPLGKALIVAPWNYPFQLLMNPLVGSISAGCCII